MFLCLTLMRDIIIEQLKDSARVKLIIANTMTDAIVNASVMMVRAFRGGGKILLAGNGGSAADAQHIAGEFVGRFRMERQALPAYALSTNTSILTALANDYSYDMVFARAIEALACHPADLFVAISTSGNSPNILKAVEASRARRIATIGLTGRGGGRLKSIVDLPIVVPSDDTQRIQEAHITIGHIICDLVERELFDKKEKY